jgi:porphobilinogen synthase
MHNEMDIIRRPRRNRKTPLVRNLVAENRVHRDQLVEPLFVVPGQGIVHPIKAMPGIAHRSVDQLLPYVEGGLKKGLNKILLFGAGESKTAYAETASNPENAVNRAIRSLKQSFGDDIWVITDVCVCAYTDHGHCGVLENNRVVNDPSIELLTQMALSHARAGADVVAPSDMMDGRISAMRSVLDHHGLEETGIMSYAIKFASAYYGPFREAADSSPQQGDRKSYQMDYRNGREAMLEGILDEQEGADVLMVKPALAYLDVIKDLRSRTLLPIACYNVSGEYAMVKAAAERGFIQEDAVVIETLHAFVRAGASILISYHCRDAVEKGWI